MEKRPKAKQGQEEETEEMKKFIIGADNGGGKLVRRKGAANVKKDGVTQKKQPLECFRKIL